MHLIVLRAAFLLLGAWLLFAAWAQRELAAAPPPSEAGAPSRVLVLYQPEGDSLGTELHATMTANLAGRFGRAELRDLNLYALGDATEFDAMFVLPAARGSAPPHALVADARASRRPVIWIQHGAQALFADPGFVAAQGWVPAPPRVADYAEVRYKDRDFPRDRRAAPLVTEPMIRNPERARIEATARAGGGRQVSWAVRSGHLLFVLESPFLHPHEDDRYLVFADLLFGMLAPDAPARRRAMVRIDGIGPASDPARIRAFADLLAAQNVPFALAAESGASALPPPLAAALDHATERGGVLLPEGLAGARYGRIAYRSGEARGGRAGPAGPGQLQFFPFEVVDRRGELVLPENLGVLGGADGRAPEAVVASAGRNLAVRDGFASFATSAEGSPEALLDAVRGIRALGYRFVDPREVVRDAPAHAPRRAAAAPAALAAAGWAQGLPPLAAPVLAGLLLLALSLCLAGETALDLLFRPRRRRRRAARAPVRLLPAA